MGGQLGLLLVWVMVVGWVFLGCSFFLISFLWIVVYRVAIGKSDIENLLDLFLLLALHCIHMLSLIFFFLIHMYKVFLILWVLDLLEEILCFFCVLMIIWVLDFQSPKIQHCFLNYVGSV